MRKISLLVITLILMSSSCLAADWQWIGSTAEKGYFFDSSSIRYVRQQNQSDKDCVSVWVKTVFDETYARKTFKDRTPAFFLIKYYINFEANKMKATSGNAYDKAGHVIGNVVDGDNTWHDIIPGSHGEAIATVIHRYSTTHEKDIEKQTGGE